MRRIVLGAVVVGAAWAAACTNDYSSFDTNPTDGGGGSTSVGGYAGDASADIGSGGKAGAGGSSGAPGKGGASGAGGSTTGGAAGTGGSAAGAAGTGGAAAGSAGTAGGGTGGVAGSAGTAGQAGCGNQGDPCTKDGQCCKAMCGPFWANADDCDTDGQCAECRSNGECPQGRCDDCACLSPLGTGEDCNEESDCSSGKCGGAWADAANCDIDSKCAECRSNGECGSGRCDQCVCIDKVAPGEDCNEDSDCTDGKCGPAWANANDCAIDAKCAECRTDGECMTGRCDGCACVDKLANGEGCDEDSDCTSNHCHQGNCAPP
ncbi:MAG: hypothetical protein HY898_09545 [Deltaproteobacteria bacterium]|nr:hypothetical protein [Deltaproteobacteria bacterium]